MFSNNSGKLNVSVIGNQFLDNGLSYFATNLEALFDVFNRFKVISFRCSEKTARLIRRPDLLFIKMTIKMIFNLP